MPKWILTAEDYLQADLRTSRWFVVAQTADRDGWLVVLRALLCCDDPATCEPSIRTDILAQSCKNAISWHALPETMRFVCYDDPDWTAIIENFYHMLVWQMRQSPEGMW